MGQILIRSLQNEVHDGEQKLHLEEAQVRFPAPAANLVGGGEDNKILAEDLVPIFYYREIEKGSCVIFGLTCQNNSADLRYSLLQFGEEGNCCEDSCEFLDGREQ